MTSGRIWKAKLDSPFYKGNKLKMHVHVIGHHRQHALLDHHLRIGQPDPPGLETEKRRHLLQRGMQRLVDVVRSVQRFGDRLENAQLV